jgi:hypothetical protein
MGTPKISMLIAYLKQYNFNDKQLSIFPDWINSNPKYSPVDGAAGANLETLNRKMVSSFMTREQHQETMDLFLKAARINHHGRSFETFFLFFFFNTQSSN